MDLLQVGDKAPDFTLADEQDVAFKLSSQHGQKLLLVFYPGDNTPVCTRQLCDYRDGIEAFAGLGVRVVGISGDGAESHRKFKAKHDLPFYAADGCRPEGGCQIRLQRPAGDETRRLPAG